MPPMTQRNELNGELVSATVEAILFDIIFYNSNIVEGK
jgi:hypothetical protein